MSQSSPDRKWGLSHFKDKPSRRVSTLDQVQITGTYAVLPDDFQRIISEAAEDIVRMRGCVVPIPRFWQAVIIAQELTAQQKKSLGRKRPKMLEDFFHMNLHVFGSRKKDDPTVVDDVCVVHHDSHAVMQGECGNTFVLCPDEDNLMGYEYNPNLTAELIRICDRVWIGAGLKALQHPVLRHFQHRVLNSGQTQ